jgi:hypothetical protein
VIIERENSGRQEDEGNKPIEVKSMERGVERSSVLTPDSNNSPFFFNKQKINIQTNSEILISKLDQCCK